MEGDEMTRRCRECTAPITGRALFCTASCRSTFNNRRAMRGAELYDLFRALRRERLLATELGLWRDICRLEEAWQIEDDRERPGRRSYVQPREVVRRLADTGKISRRWTTKQFMEDAERRRKYHAAKQKQMVATRQAGDRSQGGGEASPR